MPNLPRRTRTTYSDIPTGLVGSELAATVNERMRRLASNVDDVRKLLSEASTSADGSSAISGTASSGSHAARLGTTGAGAGVAWLESDRTVVYVDSYYAGGLMSAPFASRPADLGAKDIGFRFLANDNEIYYLWTGTLWVYESGMQRGTLADLVTPTANDEGYLYYVTDYHHTLRWTGSVWSWAPGDVGSLFIQYYTAAPNAGDWIICDGSSITYLKSDGTTGTTVTPDLCDGCYPRGGTGYSGTKVAAAAPGLTGSTASAGSHDHGGFTTGPSGTSTVSSGAGSTVASAGHTHGLVIEAAHVHAKGTLVVDASAEPKHIILIPYMRR